MFIYKEISKKYHWILFLLMMIIAYKAKSIIENEDIFTAYFYLRNEINYGDGDSGYGIVKYLFTLSYFILFLSSFSFSVNSTKKYRTVFIKSFILCLLISVLSTSRTQVLTVFLSAFLPLLFFQKINIKMMISLLILIFVPLFLITGYILGKLSASSEGVKEILSSYFVAPMVAFSQISYPSSLPGNGESTFRFFYAIFEAFGSNRSASSLIQPFIYVPTPTNLYTSFLPYYTDFGTIGVLVIISILGVLHGLLYRWVSSGELSLFKIFIYIVSIFPLLSVYSTETHFLQISLWIQYFVFGLIFIKICPRLKLKSSLNYER
jgi:oligosaccharide repeat unit polymerase